MGRSQNADAIHHPRFSDYLARARKVAGDLERQVRFGEVWSGVRTVRIAADAVVRAMVIDNFKQGQPQVKVDLVVTTQPIDDGDVADTEDLLRGFAFTFDSLEPVVVQMQAKEARRVFVLDDEDTLVETPLSLSSYSSFTGDEELRVGAVTWDSPEDNTSVSWGDVTQGSGGRYSTTSFIERNIYYQGRVWAKTPEQFGGVYGAAKTPDGVFRAVTVRQITSNTFELYYLRSAVLTEPDTNEEVWEVVHTTVLDSAVQAPTTGFFFSPGTRHAVSVAVRTTYRAEIYLDVDPEEGGFDIHYYTTPAIQPQQGQNSSASSDFWPDSIDMSTQWYRCPDELGGAMEFFPGPVESGDQANAVDSASAFSSIVFPGSGFPASEEVVLALDYSFDGVVKRLYCAWEQGFRNYQYSDASSAEALWDNNLVDAACINPIGTSWHPALDSQLEVFVGSSSSGSGGGSTTATPVKAVLYVGEEPIAEHWFSPQGSAASTGDYSFGVSVERTAQYKEVPGNPNTNPGGWAHVHYEYNWSGGGGTSAELALQETTQRVLFVDLRYDTVVLGETVETVTESANRSVEDYTHSKTRHLQDRVKVVRGGQETLVYSHSDSADLSDPEGFSPWGAPLEGPVVQNPLYVAGHKALLKPPGVGFPTSQITGVPFTSGNAVFAPATNSNVSFGVVGQVRNGVLAIAVFRQEGEDNNLEYGKIGVTELKEVLPEVSDTEYHIISAI